MVNWRLLVVKSPGFDGGVRYEYQQSSIHGGGLDINYKVEQVFPGVKREVLSERAPVFKAGLARGQLRAHGPIAPVHAVEDGVYQVDQEDQGRPSGGEALVARAVVMLQVVALGLERILVFVLDFTLALVVAPLRESGCCSIDNTSTKAREPL